MNKTVGPVALLLCSLAIPPITEPAGAQSSQQRSEQTTEARDIRGDADVWQEGAFFQALGAGMFAASAGDLASTEWGLRQPGVYEANPFAGNRGLRFSTHVLVPAAVWWTTKRLHKNGHERTALWVRIAVTAAYGYAVMHNLRTAGSAQPLP